MKQSVQAYIPNKKKFVEEKQFIKEVRKPATLNDKRYATVYDAYVDEMSGACVCNMEYIDGQTLNKWLDDIMLNGFDFNEKDPLIGKHSNMSA